MAVRSASRSSLPVRSSFNPTPANSANLRLAAPQAAFLLSERPTCVRPLVLTLPLASERFPDISHEARSTLWFVAVSRLVTTSGHQLSDIPCPATILICSADLPAFRPTTRTWTCSEKLSRGQAASASSNRRRSGAPASGVRLWRRRSPFCVRGPAFVWKVDRLGRHLREMLDTAHELQSQGVKLRSLTEAADAETPTGRLMFNLLGPIAEYFLDLNRERTQEGLKVLRSGLHRQPLWRARGGAQLGANWGLGPDPEELV